VTIRFSVDGARLSEIHDADGLRPAGVALLVVPGGGPVDVAFDNPLAVKGKL